MPKGKALLQCNFATNFIEGLGETGTAYFIFKMKVLRVSVILNTHTAMLECIPLLL